jgi:PhoH-like ATPase
MPDDNKIFILDTNVILHDSTCIHHFDEHDIIIPITVLEELDQFKKGTQTVNFHAREFVRELERGRVAPRDGFVSHAAPRRP